MAKAVWIRISAVLEVSREIKKGCLLFVGILMYIYSGVAAQDVVVVLDSASGKPVASCYLIGGNEKVLGISDKKGRVLSDCKAPVLFFKHIGYVKKTLIPSCSIELDTVYLNPASHILSEVTIIEYSAERLLQLAKAAYQDWKNSKLDLAFYLKSDGKYSTLSDSVREIAHGKTKDSRMLHGKLSRTKKGKWYIGQLSGNALAEMNPIKWGFATETSPTRDFLGYLGEVDNILSHELSPKKIDWIKQLEDTVFNGIASHTLSVVFEVKKEKFSFWTHRRYRLYLDKVSHFPVGFQSFTYTERLKEVDMPWSWYGDISHSKVMTFTKSSNGWLPQFFVANKEVFAHFHSWGRYGRDLKVTNIIFQQSDKTTKEIPLQKLSGRDIAERIELINPPTRAKKLLEQIYKGEISNRVVASLDSSWMPDDLGGYLMRAYQKAQDIKVYKADQKVKYPSEKEHTQTATVNKGVKTAVGFSFLIDHGQSNKSAFFNGTDFYLRDPRDKKVYQYPTKEFWFYKTAFWTNAAFMPLAYPELFVEEVLARAETQAAPIARESRSLDGKQVVVFTIPSPLDQLEVFFDVSDSSFAGYAQVENGKRKQVWLTDFEEITEAEFRKQSQDFFANGHDIQKVKAKGTFRKILKQNIHGKKPFRLFAKRPKQQKARENESLPTIPALDGSTVVLDGKYTLLAYWQSFCPYCWESMPLLSKLHGELGIKDFQVLGVNPVDIDPIGVSKDLKSEGITYPNTMDAEGLLDGYEPNAYPTYILLGKDGQVLDMQEGYNAKALERMVRKHVK